MKTSIRLITFLLLVTLIVGVAAAQDTTFVQKDPFIVGYSVYDMQQPYWQEYARGVQEAAEDAGAQFVLSDQKSSQETQVSGSLDLINQGISALVVSPVQPSALPASIDAAHAANIPVIIGDVGAEGDYDAFVLSDNYEGGRLAAQYVVEQLADVEGPKEVLMILLHPGSAVGEVRAAGFRDEIALHEDFTLVAELNGNDTVQGGYQVTQDTLAANPNLAAVYATNDPEAIGASQALKAAGVTGVVLVGFNGDAPALELIQSGEMSATIRQDPYGQGRAAVEAAQTLLAGEAIDYSDPDTRSIYFPVDVVTADNVADFMAPATPAYEKKDPFLVGYSVYDMQQPYWQEYARGVQEAAEDAGAQFVLSDQKSSQETQVSGSLDLINQGISALVVSPVQPSALPASIDAAHAANIPVIIGDVGAEGDYDAFVLSDNYEGGRLAAQYVVEQLADVEGPKEVLMILLHPGSAVGEVRAAGFRDEMALHEDFTIVAELNGNDTVQGGYQVTQDTLAANPNLAAIYATNDPEAIGASQALKAAGLNGVSDVVLVGFNGDAPALELIQGGEMSATIRQDPYGQGRAAVEAALQMLDGQAVEYSDAATRSIYFPVDVVTADNVDMYMP